MADIGIDIAFPTKALLNLEKEFKAMAGKASPGDLNRALAHQVRFRIKRRIERLPRRRNMSPKHNTPTPLMSTLRPVKTSGKDALVIMNRMGRGVDPLWVEEGTKPHQIVRKSTGEVFNHPGAKPTHFFSRGFNDFVRWDYTKIVNNFADNMVKFPLTGGLHKDWGSVAAFTK